MPTSPAPTLARRVVAEGLALVLVVTVSAIAAGFAHQFREAIFRSITVYADSHLATEAASSLNPVALFVLVTGGLLLASWIGRRARGMVGNRLGLSVLAAAARGEGPGPSVPGTLLRSSGTLAASAALASLGRESAILESGGAIGFGLAEFLRRRVKSLPAGLGPAVGAAGIAAAFAAAYHAPFAGIIYLEEHLGVRRHKRTLLYTLIGALTGDLIAVDVLGGKRVFSPVQGARSDVVVMGAIVVVPALIGSTLFLRMRDRVSHLVGSGTDRARMWMVVSAVIAGVLAVVSRLVAGNGMEAIRLSATGATVALVFALAFGKMFATAAAVGSGAPGGVFSPSMAVAAGWALLTFEAMHGLHIGLPAPVWSGVIAALAVGIAIGLKSPVVAVFAVPEMTGDLRLLPAIAVVVAVAVGLRWLAREVLTRGRARPELPSVIHNEDA
jgi:chloride channel protein, CIC family